MNDKSLVDNARKRLKSWNTDNPSSPIKIQMPQIIRRVREMRKNKAQRIAETAPKEIRAKVRQELTL